MIFGLRECLFSLFMILILPATLRAESCIAEECFPAQVTWEGETLPLIGVGLSRWLGFRLYTAALYARPESAIPERILEPSPKRLVIAYHRDFSSEQLISAGENQIAKLGPKRTAALRPGLDAINERYQSVKKGDRYTIDAHPNFGLRISLNSTDGPSYPGEELAAAYLGIWLSDAPVSPSLRKNLLAIPD